jgi:prepilin-type N-terminal cleavage/methylation domain-containing protein
MLKNSKTQAGFTLIELAIVLVIMGLIAGGVLTSQHLIRSAELKNLTAKIDSYNQAVLRFRTKYYALPGDIGKAQNLWGAELVANCPGSSATPSTGVATCNGNEDGKITFAPGAGFGNEAFRAWQHLANADMVDGSFTGVDGGLSNSHALVGENAPVLPFANVTAVITYLGSSSVEDFAGDLKNVLLVGQPNVGKGYPDMPFLRAEDALNIDEKQDDGAPGTGSIRTRNATKHPGCATSDDALTALYDATNTGINCQLVYVTGY